MKFDVPPALEILAVSATGCTLGYMFGESFALIGQYPDPALWGRWMLSGCGLVTLWTALASVATRKVKAARLQRFELMPDPPETTTTVKAADGWNTFHLKAPGLRIGVDDQLNQWMALWEHKFGIRFRLLRQVAAYLLTKRKFVYQEVSPRILTRAEWDKVYPALIASGWVVMKGRSIVGLTTAGRRMLEYIEHGAPPPLRAYAVDDTQPIRTHARRTDG